MKTRRSKKSFEMPPPRRRRSRKRKALNVVNETIVLSDSDSENEVQIADDNPADDDIQVIDVAEVSDASQGPNMVPCCSSRLSEERKDIKSEEDIAAPAPPVINIGDEPDQTDDDGVEVVAVLVSREKRSSTGTSKRRSTLKRKSSNGNLAQMQESIKKAKTMVRRSSLVSTGSANLLQHPLNRIAPSSKKINRQNKKWNNRRQIGNMNFQGYRRNGLFQNRTRENNRQVIFRPGNDQLQQNNNNLYNPINFSFEINPFIPTNTSTPANRRNDERAPWMPNRRQGRDPPPIAPGSNIMNAGQEIQREKGTLRPIVIDGSNVAFGHGGMLPGGGRPFSARGIQICIDYFKRRGHKEIVVFVPRFRLKKSECRDPELLEEMERLGHVKFTPSREAGGQRIASYDDLFVVQYAHETGGIVISNDNFKDLYEKKQHLQDTIKFRLLQYTWVTEHIIMFPEDPLGRNGPSLDQFLRF